MDYQFTSWNQHNYKAKILQLTFRNMKIDLPTTIEDNIVAFPTPVFI